MLFLLIFGLPASVPCIRACSEPCGRPFDIKGARKQYLVYHSPDLYLDVVLGLCSVSRVALVVSPSARGSSQRRCIDCLAPLCTAKSTDDPPPRSHSCSASLASPGTEKPSRSTLEALSALKRRAILLDTRVDDARSPRLPHRALGALLDSQTPSPARQSMRRPS